VKEAKVTKDYEALCQVIREAKHLSKDRRQELLVACQGMTSAKRTIEPEEIQEWMTFHQHQNMKFGAIGGHITLTTCFTSIRNIRTYRCSACREEAYVNDPF